MSTHPVIPSSSSASSPYWEDSYWVNPPFTDYCIIELDIHTFTPEGTLAAATQRIDQLTKQGINALVINPDTLFTVTSAQNLCAVPTGQTADEAEQLRHFVDICHYEGMAVCVDLHLTSTDMSTAAFGDDHFAATRRQARLENAIHWLRDFHIDALRLTGTTAPKVTDHFMKRLREAANALTASTGRQYYLLVDCEASPVALMGQYKQQFLCQVEQPQHTTSLSDSTDAEPSATRAYKREFIYEKRFARALDDLLGQVA